MAALSRHLRLHLTNNDAFAATTASGLTVNKLYAIPIDVARHAPPI